MNKLPLIYRSFLLVMFAIVVAFLSIQSPIDPAMATLWVIDYQDEFLKRALAGEILQHVTGAIYHLATINLIVKGAIYSFAVTFALFVARFYRNNMAVAIGLLLSAFAIQQFGYDVGRFDPINQLITIVILFVISISRSWMAVFIAISLSIFMLMVHEAAALLNIPVVFVALCFLACRDDVSLRLSLQPALVYLLVCLVAFALVIAFGGFDKHTPEQWQAYILAKPADFTLDPAALGVQGASLQHSVSMSVERLFSASTLGRLLRALLVSGATLILMTKSYKVVVLQYPKAIARLIWLPILAIVPMFFLGIDFYRWISAMQLGYFLLLGVILYHRHLKLEVGNKLLFVWILLSLYSGPFGVTVALPDRWRLPESFIKLFS